MARAKWVVGMLTVALLGTGIGLLRSTEGARTAPTSADALPSRALGLSGHRRLVEQLEHAGQRTSGKGSRPSRASAITPLRPSPPRRLLVPALGADLPFRAPEAGPPGADVPSGGRTGQGVQSEEAYWEAGTPAPGSAGVSVVSAPDLRLAELRRGLTVEVVRGDGRTAVFTVDAVSPAGVSRRGQRPGRAQLRLVSGETTTVARLTGHRRTG
ncbi:class F sortase [Streptomyces sp. 2P-4]|uniref:class F sortase n=1 Tax=Streptomyces sp. 2P-4 TaxID=2931974 RepID=UPI0025407364|nr:class F sortase [Streptomyces sp. 2P-4]